MTTHFDEKPAVKGRAPQIPFLVEFWARNRMQRFVGSLRIPVVPANRNLLRELRASELAAWQQADRRRTPTKFQQDGGS
jgi:hypothetical protein